MAASLSIIVAGAADEVTRSVDSHAGPPLFEGTVNWVPAALLPFLIKISPRLFNRFSLSLLSAVLSMLAAGFTAAKTEFLTAVLGAPSASAVELFSMAALVLVAVD